ncbi:MAG: efflux transporter outer membrane subunit, partial [Neisseriaceae bacterium]|nr:efflux transporter outer membrane subunit [Neisseriaceae bacterium]
RLSEISHKAGVISDIALNQSISQIESAKAAYAAAKTQRDAARNALTVLVGGVLPENLPQGKPLTLQAQFNSQIPAGLSSDILTQRPDILAAEQSLQAANAQIGAARAAFFPSIRLTGSGGFATGELDNLFHGTARTWSFSPQITVPIFTWGALKSNLDLSHIRKNMAIVQYEQAVQNAFRDTSDALNAQKTIADQAAAQEKIAQATGKVLQLTEMRHKHGVSSSLDLLDAQRQSFAAETALINTRLQQLNNRVDLYNAFGGGVK